jgi:hypothetical protein
VGIVKRTQKQLAGKRLAGAQARHRAAHKATKAEQALWIEMGGQVAWRAELDRRRRARNERTRERTRQLVAEKRLSQQMALFADERQSA